jgi:hypothetical protein
MHLSLKRMHLSPNKLCMHLSLKQVYLAKVTERTTVKAYYILTSTTPWIKTIDVPQHCSASAHISAHYVGTWALGHSASAHVPT